MQVKPLLTYYAKEREQSELDEFALHYDFEKDYNSISLDCTNKQYEVEIPDSSKRDVQKHGTSQEKDILTILMATQTFTKSIGEPRDSDY